MRNYINKNIKLIFGIVIGIIMSGLTVYAATIIYDSDEVSYDNTNTNLELNGNGVNNVQDAIDALFTKASEYMCTNSPFNLGDYIDMTPTSTSYTIDNSLTNGTAMTINPSYLNVWRVIRINKDCSVEVVSEYVLNGADFKGLKGYKNYIYVLNEIARQFANTTYTLTPSMASVPRKAFRIIGYNGQTEKIEDDSKIIQSSPYPWPSNTNVSTMGEELGGGDTLYQTDLDLLTAAGVSLKAYEKAATVTNTYTQYLLASRFFSYTGEGTWNYLGRIIDANGNPYYTRIIIWNGSTFSENRGGGALRPIITLKAGLSIASGNGTSDSHYVLNAS